MKYNPNRFRILTKANDLIIYTHNTTLSIKNYPKKTRFCLVQKIQECSFAIQEAILDANEIKANTAANKAARIAKQDEAIKQCKQMLNLIDISYQLRYISLNMSEYWAKMTLDVMYMTIGWQKKE